MTSWWHAIKRNDVYGLAWVRLPIDGSQKNVQLVRMIAVSNEWVAGDIILGHLDKVSGLDLGKAIVEANRLSNGGGER